MAEEEISVSSGTFQTLLPLKYPLESPRDITIEVGSDFSQNIPVRLRRLYGTARFFGGSPVRFPMVTTALYRRSDFFMTAVGDENGNFEILLPEKTSSIAVFDKDYSKTNLECWIYDADLKEDTRLNVRMDKIEVFRLYAWPGEMKIYLHFVPMSITRINEVIRKGVRDESAIASDPEAWPLLRKEDVRVFVGEDEAQVVMFEKVPDITRLNKQDVIRPGYILSVNSVFRGKVIRVEVQTAAMEKGRVVQEKGEGFFLGFLND